MFIRLNLNLLLLLCMMSIVSNAQNVQSPSLNIGDPAPQLLVKEWLKGTPMNDFEKGQTYVVEFWATWCHPCIVSMPHLSNLARRYKDKVIILGIDIMEKTSTSVERIKAFVDSMGSRMDYNVAIDDRDLMLSGWFTTSGEQGIPKTFVVDNDGKLAWIGHPKELDKVLHKIVNNTWDIKKALDERKELRRLAEIDDSLRIELNMYIGNPGKPDSALQLINEMVRKEPKLKYAPFVAIHTFSSLLKTDMHKAYQFGKELLASPVYEDPPYQLIIDNIKWYSDKLNITKEIYELGAETYQAKIDQNGQFINIAKNFKGMAEMYWQAKNKSKAINAIQKAIEALESEKNYSISDLTEFESLLINYKKM